MLENSSFRAITSKTCTHLEVKELNFSVSCPTINTINFSSPTVHPIKFWS